MKYTRPKPSQVRWRRASLRGYHGEQIVRVCRVMSGTSVVEVLVAKLEPHLVGHRIRTQTVELEGLVE